MDKNWLIRTKSNHLLGPVSKEKVIELYKNGSIKPDDEVCSGNGFWFFIREDDLVERFLTGAEVQSFNPISEARDVLGPFAGESNEPQVVDDITIVNGLNISMLNEAHRETNSTPPLPLTESSRIELTTKEAVRKKKNNQEVKKSKGPVREAIPLKEQAWLKYISVVGFTILFLLIYYRKSIIRHIFSGEIRSIQLNLISVANAQEDIPDKKKSF